MQQSSTSTIDINTLREKYRFYMETITPFVHLNTTNDEELKQIYQNIKTHFLDTKIYTPYNIYFLLGALYKMNNRYMKSYWKIFKLIYEEYQADPTHYLHSVLLYFFYKEYGIPIPKHKKLELQKYELEKYTLEVHEQNTVSRAIMDDNEELFIAFIEKEDFNKNQILYSDFYPNPLQGLQLIEICCYYGSVKCFKILRERFHSKITRTCLNFSLMGRNEYIMNECLKKVTPDVSCMHFAIYSHNTHFITSLMDKYHFELDLYKCAYFANLDAFFAYLERTNDVFECAVYSPLFVIKSLVEFFISQGANINQFSKNKQFNMVICATFAVSIPITELLISHGVDINANYYDGINPLFLAAQLNVPELAKLYISNGINVNDISGEGNSALHLATFYGCKEMVETLIMNGADVNVTDVNDSTPLHYAVERNNKDIVKLLFTHHSNINAKDKHGITPLEYAIRSNYKGIVKVLTNPSTNRIIKKTKEVVSYTLTLLFPIYKSLLEKLLQ